MNIPDRRLVRDSLGPVHYKKNYYVLLQFDKLPDPGARKELSGTGVRLFDYLPGNAFLAELPEGFSADDLRRYAVSGVHVLPGSLKIAPRVLERPDGGAEDPDNLIAVSYFGTIPAEDVRREVTEAGARIIATKVHPDHVLFVQAGRSVLTRLAALPFVSYLGLQSIKSYPLNYNDRAAHGISAISAPSGRNLQGRGVTVGIGDNADPYTHIDFTGRLIERFSGPVDFHGTHVSGSVGGGGILDPRYRGMAPKATIVSQLFTDVLVNAPAYVNDFNMVLTNNSYSIYPNGCLFEGEYDAYSNYIDAQMNSYPSLLHVLAAGNDGTGTCTPFPTSFGSVKSGLQSAKNVLSVGNITNVNTAGGVYVINNGSSRGPVNDGRLKPEIVTGGTSIQSTYPNNSYGSFTGTSQASPATTGTLALLYERYRQLHGGADPTAALIKTIVCNSATDLGNPGPDFTYGFGMLNARVAVESMENNEYFTGAMSNGGTATFTVSGVPAGTQQVKILLYWQDTPAAAFSSVALVNDLDLTVKEPGGALHHPMILDPSPAHVKDNAVEGEDHLNNIEQVVINNPPAGDFTVTVTGTSIPAGPQNYIVSYQILKPSVVLDYPFGNETWVPGLAEIIRWTAYGGDPNTFTLEYSADHGATWATISNSIPAANRLFSWTTPPGATNQALIRITRNGTPYSDVSDYDFTILGQPVIALTNPCQGYAQLNWGAIPSATSYDILQLKGDSMQVVANTNTPTYLLNNLNRDSTYWLAVRAVNGTTPGRRSIAASIRPSGGACALTSLDNDLTVDSLIGTRAGRVFTSSALGSSVPIRVETKNLGTIPTSGTINFSYRVNGGGIVTEAVSPVIAPNSVYNYTFSQAFDFSAPGLYTLQAWVSYPGDPQAGNDTLTTIIKQLNNDPIVLNAAFTEGFESASPGVYTMPVQGFAGSDRSDFSASNANGRARTFINTGFARTGIRCATLDQSRFSTSSTADSLITTFNLSNYSGTDQIWLDFYYRNQGIDFQLPGNQIWIRGNDQAAWVPVYKLDASAASIGNYQASPAIDITGILSRAVPAQTISSSFQVKFGEEGYTSANSVITDGNVDDGYSFDDITLTRSVNDVALAGLVSPGLVGICNLSNSETIMVKVKNYSAAQANNIAITYSINGVKTTESIPLIKAFDSVVYTFTHKADLSAYQAYTLTAWVSNTGDTYQRNDTLPPVKFQTAPVISSFPYLEGFENSNGYWFAGGVNSSWAWGTPAKGVINKAANGSKAWVTSLDGTYNNSEQSYLYSPCFDLSQLTQPVLSFSHIFQTEDNCDCDYHWTEYTTDGISWTKLGVVGAGTHWYDYSTLPAWKMSDTKWHVSSYDIPGHPSKIRFRFVMSSDPGTTFEGIGIDDVHIFDKAPVYGGVSIASGLSQAVSGSGWVHFDVGGKRVASINPNGQDLGNTNVKVFIHTGGIRDTGNLYYLDRNIVIQPSNVPMADVSVRYYFLDSEANALIQATGCPGCTGIPDAYQAGVLQYSTPLPTEEDSTLSNDSAGTYHYLQPQKDISIIPYDNGYYAQYQVSGFSEFWINSGLPPQTPLPLALLSFTATKTGKTGLLQWSTTEETTTSRYVLERRTDSTGFKALDSVAAKGNSGVTDHYQSTDKHLAPGNNFYRLRMIDQNGSYKYSPVRILSDTVTGLVISIYPNPLDAGSELNISTSVNCQDISLIDVSGRIVRTLLTHGFLNTLSSGGLARGVYFISVGTDAGRKVQKILVK